MNTLIYIMDSARYDDFSRAYISYSHPLQKHFIQFPNAYSFGTWTKPASSSILFGLPSRVTGMKRYNDAIPSGLEASYLPLKQAGFSVNLISSNVIVSSAFGYKSFFDFFCDEFNDESSFDISDMIPVRNLRAIQRYSSGRSLRYVSSDALHRIYLDNVVNKKDSNVTFIWAMDTHDPYFEFDANGQPVNVITNSQILSADPEIIEKSKKLHRLSIDRNLKTLFTMLESLDESVFDDMFIVILADHGEAFGEGWQITNYRRLKRRRIVSHDVIPIEEVIRIPMLVKYPQNSEININANALVTTNSILPTIYDLYNLVPEMELWETSILENRHRSTWEVVCEHWSKNGSYVSYINRSLSHLYIGRIPYDVGEGNRALSSAKNILIDGLDSQLGASGIHSLSDKEPSKINVSETLPAFQKYVDKCLKYPFKASKLEIQIEDNATNERLRALGYLE